MKISKMTFYQLKDKKTNAAKLCTDIRWWLRCKKWSKTVLIVLKKQNLQNQTISELYNDDNKSKYSSNPKDILKCAYKIYDTHYIKETTSKDATTEFPTKIPSREKVFN